MQRRLVQRFRNLFVAIAVATFLAAFKVSGQTTTNLTFNFEVNYVEAQSGTYFWGSGTVAPFGTAILNSTSVTTAPVDFTFQNGSSFHFEGTPTATGNGCALVGSITSGTGAFAGATGSAQLGYTPCGPSVPPAGVEQVTGTGSITVPSSGAFTVTPQGLVFSFVPGGPTSETQPIILENGTMQAVSYSITTSGESWLSVSPSSGTVGAFVNTPVGITVNSTGLAPGVYFGNVTVSAAGKQFPVTVTVKVDQLPEIVLSQTGLQFLAVSGGSVTPAQTIAVLNPSNVPLSFSASASVLSGGNWLSVTPSSGSTSASASGLAAISVNAGALQPGVYYGTVSFAASGAADSHTSATVVLNVVAPANSPGASVEPAGLVFVGSAGGTAPAAQTLTITNPSPSALSYVVTPFSGGTTTWLSAAPSSGTVDATHPASISVQANVQGLQPGAYIGNLDFTLMAPGATSAGKPQNLQIQVVLIVQPQGSSPSAAGTLQKRAVACTPTRLVPVFTATGAGFIATVGWPTPLAVSVVDDCGNAQQSGSVTVTFSSGDAALPLTSIGSGNLGATWSPAKTSSAITMTAVALESQAALTGSASIGGTLQPSAGAPAVSTGGIVSAISFVPNQPLAPGSFGAIFGTSLNGSQAQSEQFPLSSQLGGTSVFMGGEQVPLLFAAGGQVNFVVPYDLPVNSTQQLLVQNVSAISVPQPVVIVSAMPAIVTQNGAGTGAALIGVVQADGTPLPNDSPVTAGDVVVFYCSGLGAVSPSITAGSQTPVPPPFLQTVDPVTVMIGQQPAKVLFAGLAPSFAQLYQVNVQVPGGLSSGTAVVTMSAGGQQSAPVTITIQ